MSFDDRQKGFEKKYEKENTSRNTESDNASLVKLENISHLKGG